VQCTDRVARVHLLLNRASPWLDLNSYIPYEGKIVIRNKRARELFVRIPLYIEAHTILSRVGEHELMPQWFGRYLRFRNLKPRDTVTIEFPLKDWSERWRA
jgi:hypothetical protein